MAQQRVRTLVKGRLYMRERDIAKVADPSMVVRAYRVRSFNEMACKRCPNLEERFSKEICGPCDAYLGQIDLAERLRIDGNKYIAFPLGAQKSVERRLGIRTKIVNDLRTFPKMQRKYKVTVDLYDGTPAPDGTTRINQRKAVDDWLSNTGIGVIQAGARSGKTVLATVIATRLGLKTLVVADNDTILGQFWDTFCGDGSKRVCATNIPPERVVIIRKMEDFLKPHEVALVTYQKFIRASGDARIATFINGKYGLLIGDEIHGAAAQAYGSFLLKLSIPYRLGLSATPKRKDGRYHIAEATYGPVIVKLDKVGLKPLIKIARTGRFAGRRQRAWHLLSAMWATDAVRNKQVVDLAWDAIDRGHKAVLIPVDRTNHIDTIVEMLNNVGYERHRKNRNLPEVVALPFDGRIPIGKPRERRLARFDRARSPFLFLVAQRSLVKQAIDLKRPSCIICPIPMSATPKDGAPLFEQLSYRGSTPVHNKRQPEVIIMADELTYVEDMLQGLIRWEILKNDVDSVGEKRGLYFIDDSVRKFMADAGKTTAAESRLGGVIIRR